MLQKVPILFLVAVLSAAHYGHAVAQQRPGQRVFVSDELIVVLRTGPSTENRILRNLQAGTALEVLEIGDGSDYARVRELNGGTGGWVLTQYLTAEPIARDRLAGAQQELASASERISALQQQLEETRNELAEARESLDHAETTGATANAELASIRQTSASAIELRDQNENLVRRLNEREALIGQLSSENAELEAQTRQKWFGIGALVLIGGIVLGLVLPGLRRRKRSSW
jgi:SH3 domain protein